MFCVVIDLLHTWALERFPSAVLTLGNMFGFVTIAETMEYSDEDYDSPEAPNEFNDENQNSPSYNAADVPADTNEE